MEPLPSKATPLRSVISCQKVRALATSGVWQLLTCLIHQFMASGASGLGRIFCQRTILLIVTGPTSSSCPKNFFTTSQCPTPTDASIMASSRERVPTFLKKYVLAPVAAAHRALLTIHPRVRHLEGGDAEVLHLHNLWLPALVPVTDVCKTLDIEWTPKEAQLGAISLLALQLRMGQCYRMFLLGPLGRQTLAIRLLPRVPRVPPQEQCLLSRQHPRRTSREMHKDPLLRRRSTGQGLVFATTIGSLHLGICRHR
mmetsp:Transcript_23393/g.61445  ORF Transcript_23393/g.61445 Transcript_23393/m.61445 type:complete len:255 (-) Transcript_23393:783-1547(-)